MKKPRHWKSRTTIYVFFFYYILSMYDYAFVHRINNIILWVWY